MLPAERAKASRRRMLNVATGPSVAVTGHPIRLSNGTEVLSARLTPWG